MGKILYLPSFEEKRRELLKTKERNEHNRSVITHALFKLSLMRCFQTPF